MNYGAERIDCEAGEYCWLAFDKDRQRIVDFADYCRKVHWGSATLRFRVRALTEAQYARLVEIRDAQLKRLAGGG